MASITESAERQDRQDRLDRRMKETAERYVFERRVLTGCTGLLVVAAICWAVALSSDHWYELAPPPGGVLLRDSRTVLLDGHTGLWSFCSEQFHPANITAYEALTTTVSPVSTTRRPRAQPCKRMGLKGRRRRRCRLFLTRRFKFGLASRRKAAAAAAAASSATTTERPPSDYDAGLADTNLTDWLSRDFDEASQSLEPELPELPELAEDPAQEDAVLGPEDPQSETYLRMIEEELLERINDGVEDDLTVNETLSEALDEAIEEITSPTFRECRYKELFPTGVQSSGIESQLLSYMRTLVTFSVVSMVLLVLGFLSALYTFKEPRYTFKRLAAGVHFIAFCGLLVVIQVFRNAARFEQQEMQGGVDLEMGYSQVLAWLALAIQLVASFFFLLYSRKKKRNKAPNEEIAQADEPTIIGR